MVLAGYIWCVIEYNDFTMYKWENKAARINIECGIEKVNIIFYKRILLYSKCKIL